MKKVMFNPSRVDNKKFDELLQKEISLLKTWFAEKYFDNNEMALGSEIEFFILDQNYSPNLRNEMFVEEVADPSLVVESGSAELEINSTHHSLTEDCFSLLHQNTLNLWQKCSIVANQNHENLALIGSVPMANQLYKQRTYITPAKRYQLMEDCIATFYKNKSHLICLYGNETLILNEPIAISTSGLIAALQLHLQVPLSQSVLYYNVIQIISAPMLALCANSPYFNGKDLWSESRIGLMHQIVKIWCPSNDLGNVDLFGDAYLSNSFLELFNKNLQQPVTIFSETHPDEPIEHMFHLRRQNGITYRWNRPVIDFNNNQPHLRIEHRSPSTGPTITDMIANAAFFYGIVHYFVSQSTPITSLLPFELAKKNFYNAARFGMNANLSWFKGDIHVCKLLQELLPLARQGLLLLQIARDDVDYYLNIIKQRINLHQNGDIWQRLFIRKYGNDFTNMLGAYVANQYKEIPVSNWKV